MSRYRKEYNTQLNALISDSSYLSDSEYQEMIKLVKTAKGQVVKTPYSTRHLQKYDVVTLSTGEEKLVEPLVKDRNSFRFYLRNDEMYDVLHEAHTRLNHGNKLEMYEDLRKRFANVKEEAIALYLEMCSFCQRRVTNSLSPSIRKKNWYRVDLIDMLTMPDGEFHYILVYQDCFTHFVHLRPLASDRPAEIAEHLLTIFCQFGIPVAIFSHIGSIFTKLLLQELKQRWSTLNIIDGKPLQREDRFARRADDYIRDMVLKWMQKEKSAKWSEGIQQVQLMKNRAYHNTLRMSPYQALFGYDPKVGLTAQGLVGKVTLSAQPPPDEQPPKIVNVSSGGLCKTCNARCIESRNCTICYGVVIFSCTKKLDSAAAAIVCEDCAEAGNISLEEVSAVVGMPQAENESFIDPSSMLHLVLSVEDNDDDDDDE